MALSSPIRVSDRELLQKRESGTNGTGLTKNEWIEMAVILVVCLSIAASPFVYQRIRLHNIRHHPFTFRSFLVPSTGIHIKLLGISIEGPRNITRTEEEEGRVPTPQINNTEEIEECTVDPVEASDKYLPNYAVDPNLPSYESVDGPAMLAQLREGVTTNFPDELPTALLTREDNNPIPTVQH